MLLSSQLGDLNLFQPTEHLDSSVYSLLTLEERAALELALVSTLGNSGCVSSCGPPKQCNVNNSNSAEPVSAPREGPAGYWDSGAWFQCRVHSRLVQAAGATSLTNATLAV